MPYTFFIDGLALPVTPSKLTMRVRNQNKTVNLINESEVNLLKSAGLTEIGFDCSLPQQQYPFARYSGGFRPAVYFLEKLETLKVSKKPFQFIVSRTTSDGTVVFDTNIKVSLEDYTITEDAKEGTDVTVSVSLKQYREYGTKSVVVDISTGTAVVSTARTTETAPVVKTYTVQPNDTLWNISKRWLGDGSRYMEIYNLNTDKITNPNLISPGQVLNMPE